MGKCYFCLTEKRLDSDIKCTKCGLGLCESCSETQNFKCVVFDDILNMISEDEAFRNEELISREFEGHWYSPDCKIIDNPHPDIELHIKTGPIGIECTDLMK